MTPVLLILEKAQISYIILIDVKSLRAAVCNQDSPANKLDHNLAVTVVIDLFKFADVACEGGQSVSECCLQRSLRCSSCQKRSENVWRVACSVSRELKGQGPWSGIQIRRDHCLVIIPNDSAGNKETSCIFERGNTESKKLEMVLGGDISIPCFCITCKNLVMTFELGLIMTWRFPLFSALLIWRKLAIYPLFFKPDTHGTKGIVENTGSNHASGCNVGEILNS